jgi:limonene 1,2-monooxygenase
VNGTYPTVRFGAFFGPFHPVGLNPTLALKYDLELITHMDRLGFAEAWVGEHHSGGVEIIASPEIMVAAAAQRTQRIKLGLGVVSLPYHHPFMVADRLVLLDHLTEGRVIFGAGPGQLVDDCRILGIDPMDNRRKLPESLDVIVRLLAGEHVRERTDWYTVDGFLHLLPCSDIEMAVTGAWSPTGPTLAGKYGTGLLSLGATTPQGIELLASHWTTVEKSAAEHGTTVTRDAWRLLQLTHIAETEEQALEDVAHGLLSLNNYMAQISPAAAVYDSVESLVRDTNASGGGVIGTPDMLVEHIRGLQQKSGGFGRYLMLQGDWASRSATLRSYELIAEHVMPHFDGAIASRHKAFTEVLGSDMAGAKATTQAVEAAKARLGRR